MRREACFSWQDQLSNLSLGLCKAVPVQPDHDDDDGLREQVRVVWDDDDRVLLDEVDELLELVHPRLEPLAPVLLGQGVGQEGQTLVLVVQVRPVGPETLEPNPQSSSVL